MKLSPPLRWVMLGVIAYLIIAVMTAPASLLFSWIAPATVNASNVQGSVWRGSAERVDVGQIQIMDVDWVFKPLSLLTLKAGAEVEARIAGGQIKGDVFSSFFGQAGAARNVKAVLGLQDLGQIAGVPLLVNGKLGVILERISWKAGKLDGIIGNFTLAELSDTITSTPLGTFEIEFPEDQEEQIRGIVRDVDAIFGLNGALTIIDGNAYQFDGVIEPTSDTPQSVLQAMPMIGATRDREGNFTLSSSGSLQPGE